MMFDDLNAPGDGVLPGDIQPPDRPAAGWPRAGGSDGAALPDREVPLPGSAPALLHQWLDGDVGVAVVKATPGGNEAVDLWNKIHDEAETLRSRTTPLYVHKRIMEALPDDTYRMHQPWYRRPVVMNPGVLMGAAAALLGLGAVIARAALR